MRNRTCFMIEITVLLFCLCGTSTHSQTRLWSTAYYAGWMQGWFNNGHLPAREIDYGAVTHIVHFSLIPDATGLIDSDANSITPMNSAELLTRAHAAGTKVLISVGGWGSDVGFRGATSTLKRALFVANLMRFMTTRGYDGIDIDWEVLGASDATQFIAFIRLLRTALDGIQPRPLLTVATSWQPSIFAQISTMLDQVNIMTYDLSGAWPGWVTWHNAPVYDGGYRFPSTGRPVPSVDGTVNEFIAAGVPANKLGIGIDFYGYVWNGGGGTLTGGVTEPRQAWSSTPSVRANVPYFAIMQDYFQPANYHWDTAAHAAYLRIDSAGSSSDKFVSFDNETTVQSKFDYARAKGIGGVIVWELGGGYRPDQPVGQRDPLLQAARAALFNTSNPGEKGLELPGKVFLGQNYPNPFNPTTRLDFRVPLQARVSLKIYDMLGQTVATLVEKDLPPGDYTQIWNASHFASGSYLCRLEARTATGKSVVQTRKLLHLK